MWIFVIAFLGLLFYGCKVRREGFWEAPLDYNNTIALRGLCAVEIVIGHIGAAGRDPWLFLNRKAGVLVVGVFLFLSGYGLIYSLNKKENYLQGFFGHRIPKLLLPAFLVYIIYYILELADTPVGSRLAVTLKYFTFLKFSEKINWYVTELLFLYVIFYLLYRYFKVKTANIVLSALCVCFIIICYFGGAGNTWYGSTLCFPLGILFGCYESKLLLLIREKYGLVLTLSFFMTGVGVLLFFINEHSFTSNVIGRSIASAFFCIGVVAMLLKVKIGNGITDRIGTISYELFLVHEIFIFQDRFNMNLLYSICAFVLSILSGYLLHKCNERIFMKVL